MLCSRYRWVLAILLIALLTSVTYADPTHSVSFSKSVHTTSANVTLVEVDILLNASKAFSSADLSVVTSSNVTLEKVTSLLGSKAQLVAPVFKDGAYHFGFFSSENQFSGDVQVARLTFRHSGSLKGTVELKNVSVTALDPQTIVAKYPVSSMGMFEIVRATGQGTPNSPSLPSLPPVIPVPPRPVTPVNPGRPSNPGNGPGAFITLDDIVVPLGSLDVRFQDISNSWAQYYIYVLASRGVIQGRSAAEFAPNDQIIRGDFTKLLIASMNRKANSDIIFSDVNSNDYYHEYIQTAASMGIVTGYGGKFNPKATITRQDMMVILYRALVKENIILEVKADLDVFSDAHQVADYAQDAVAYLVGQGIIEGHAGKLRPRDTLTRQEASKVLYFFVGLLQ